VADRVEYIEDLDPNACIRLWLAAAEEFDLVDTARALDRCTGSNPQAPPADPLRTTLLCLLAGDRTGAHRALERADAGPDRDGRRALLTACLAALDGNDAAYRYVLGTLTVPTVPTGPTGPTGHGQPDPPTPERILVALTAEGRGDLARADELWLTLAEETFTPVTVARAAVALINHRCGPVHQQAVLFAQVAEWFDALVVPAVLDPAPVALAADLLTARGDRAGAVLLLCAVLRRNAPEHRIRELERRLARWGLRPDGRRRPARAPVLTGRTDRRVRRALIVGPRSPMRYIAVFHAVLGVAVLIAGIVLAALAHVVVRIDPASSLGPGAPVQFWSVLVGGLIVLPLVTGAVLGRVLAGPPGRWWRRSRPEPHVPHCRCLTAAAVLGPLVPEYLEHHLQPVPDAAWAAVDPGPDQVRVCPVTSVAWLVVSGSCAVPTVLLRGAVPAALEPQFPGALAAAA